MKMALPRKGFNGVEKTADTMACTNNMAESGGDQVKEEEQETTRQTPEFDKACKLC